MVEAFERRAPAEESAGWHLGHALAVVAGQPTCRSCSPCALRTATAGHGRRFRRSPESARARSSLTRLPSRIPCPRYAARSDRPQRCHICGKSMPTISATRSAGRTAPDRSPQPVPPRPDRQSVSANDACNSVGRATLAPPRLVKHGLPAKTGHASVLSTFRRRRPAAVNRRWPMRVYYVWNFRTIGNNEKLT